MRYVLKTQPYEKNIAAGTFRYAFNDIPTGVIEMWSLSHALDGYKFFRVDVDGRSLKTDGYSTLYNVVIGPDGGPENVKFRHFTTAPPAAEKGLKLKGQIVFDDDVIFVTREIGDKRFEDEFEAPLDMALPVAARWHGTSASADVLTLDQRNLFQPLITTVRPKMVETAESGYPQKVAFGDGETAVSTRSVLYR